MELRTPFGTIVEYLGGIRGSGTGKQPTGLNTVTSFTEPMIFNLSLSLAIGIVCWILSLIPVGKKNKKARNYSYGDRVWGLAPIFYSGYNLYYLIVHDNSLRDYTGGKNLVVGTELFGKYVSLESLNVICNSIARYSRMWVVCAIVTIWGARLTHHFYRRGYYSLDEQDYRWLVIKSRFKRKISWEIYNFLFIGLFQNLLSLFMTVPVYLLYQLELSNTLSTSLTAVDYFFYLLLLGSVALEAISDKQMSDFQKRKRQYLQKQSASGNGEKTDEKKASSRSKGGNAIKTNDLDHLYYSVIGFNCTGLFGLSRHPNYFADVSFWVLIFMYPVFVLLTSPLSRTGGSVNGIEVFSISLGFLIFPAIFFVVFVLSIRLTESLSAKKYRYYTLYQKSTSVLLPWPAFASSTSFVENVLANNKSE